MDQRQLVSRLLEGGVRHLGRRGDVERLYRSRQRRHREARFRDALAAVVHQQRRFAHVDLRYGQPDGPLHPVRLRIRPRAYRFVLPAEVLGKAKVRVRISPSSDVIATWNTGIGSYALGQTHRNLRIARTYPVRHRQRRLCRRPFDPIQIVRTNETPAEIPARRRGPSPLGAGCGRRAVRTAPRAVRTPGSRSC